MQRMFLMMPVVAVLAVGPVMAEESSPTVQQLQEKIQKLEARIAELEAQKDAPSAWPPAASSRQRMQKPRSLSDPFGWDPFAEMDRMHREMQQLFQDPQGMFGGSPGTHMFSQSFSFGQDLELKETPDGYRVDVDMKGMNKDKFHMDINPGSITISGEQSVQNEETSQDAYFKSSSFGSFVQTIPLPTDADTSKVKTEQQGDILVITIPKKK